MIRSLLLMSGILTSGLVCAQSLCGNMDFENGNFTGWDRGVGQAATTPPPLWTADTTWTAYNVQPNNVARHVVHTVQDYDPNIWTCGDTFYYVSPYGGSVSVRVGNSQVGMQSEKISRRISVDSSNANFRFSWASLLQDPSHSAQDQPRFHCYVTDTNGMILIGPVSPTGPSLVCSQFQVRYVKWCRDSIDLSAWLGNDVIIYFYSQDCTLGGHYGYGLVDFGCSNGFTGLDEWIPGDQVSIFPNPATDQIQVSCPGNSVVTAEMIDLSGKLVRSATFSHSVKIPVSGLSPGIYLVSVKDEGRVIRTCRIAVK